MSKRQRQKRVSKVRAVQRHSWLRVLGALLGLVTIMATLAFISSTLQPPVAIIVDGLSLDY
ncbi:MAG: hypothetical protein QXI32_00945, partial [Candidatus Bathyarchaeia archaeon]